MSYTISVTRPACAVAKRIIVSGLNGFGTFDSSVNLAAGVASAISTAVGAAMRKRLSE
jgi:hypothetical protein